MQTFFLSLSALFLVAMTVWIAVHSFRTRHLMRRTTGEVVACDVVGETWETQPSDGKAQVRPLYALTYRVLDESGQAIDIRASESTASAPIGTKYAILYNRLDPQGHHMIGMANPIWWILLNGGLGGWLGYEALSRLGLL